MGKLTRKQIEDIRNRPHNPSVIKVEALCDMAIRYLNVEKLANKWEREAGCVQAEIHAQELRESLSQPYDLPPKRHWVVSRHDLYEELKILSDRLSDTKLKLYNERKRAETAEEALDDLVRVVQERVGQALMDINYWGDND